jgi:hydrogenase maturation protein HypF
MIDKKINSPLSSGMGRLFDAVSALCGLTLNSAFHAEAPMRLEDAIQQGEKGFYPYAISESIGIGSIIKALITDLKNGVAVGIIAARFHNTLVKISVEQCVQIREKYNTNKVVLSGGSFQNKYLSEHLIKELKHKKFKVYNHQNIPSNDGGISLGQIAIASKLLNNKRP